MSTDRIVWFIIIKDLSPTGNTRLLNMEIRSYTKKKFISWKWTSRVFLSFAKLLRNHRLKHYKFVILYLFWHSMFAYNTTINYISHKLFKQFNWSGASEVNFKRTDFPNRKSHFVSASKNRINLLNWFSYVVMEYFFNKIFVSFTPSTGDFFPFNFLIFLSCRKFLNF